MSAFTTHSVIERLEEEVEALKADIAWYKEENDSLATRLVSMTNQMAQNRIASKELLDERDKEIALLKYDNESLKSQLHSARFNYERKCEEVENFYDLESHYENVMSGRDAVIADITTELEHFKSRHSNAQNMIVAVACERDALKKELEQQNEFTEKAINAASTTENELVMKISELQSQLANTRKHYEDHLQNRDLRIVEVNKEVVATKLHLENAQAKLGAIKQASDYIVNVLSTIA